MSFIPAYWENGTITAPVGEDLVRVCVLPGETWEAHERLRWAMALCKEWQERRVAVAPSPSTPPLSSPE